MTGPKARARRKRPEETLARKERAPSQVNATVGRITERDIAATEPDEGAGRPARGRAAKKRGERCKL